MRPCKECLKVERTKAKLKILEAELLSQQQATTFWKTKCEKNQYLNESLEAKLAREALRIIKLRHHQNHNLSNYKAYCPGCIADAALEEK